VAHCKAQGLSAVRYAKKGLTDQDLILDVDSCGSKEVCTDVHYYMGCTLAHPSEYD